MEKSRTFIFSLTIILTIFCSAVYVTAQMPGDLDTAFNGTGLIRTGFGFGGDRAYATAIQTDGKIIAAGSAANGSTGDFALVRYNTDGSIDTSFGTNGKVITYFGVTNYAIRGIALQPDGKIVAAGFTFSTVPSNDFTLTRYNIDGSLDSSFGNGGRVKTDIINKSDGAYAMAIQPDGKIVAAGFTLTGGGHNFALTRYNTNGSLDSSFGTDGKVVTNISGVLTMDNAYAVVIQSDGKIVVAGTNNPNSGGINFALVRYNTDGSLDSSFGTGGKYNNSNRQRKRGLCDDTSTGRQDCRRRFC